MFAESNFCCRISSNQRWLCGCNDYRVSEIGLHFHGCNFFLVRKAHLTKKSIRSICFLGYLLPWPIRWGNLQATFISARYLWKLYYIFSFSWSSITSATFEDISMKLASLFIQRRVVSTWGDVLEQDGSFNTSSMVS